MEVKEKEKKYKSKKNITQIEFKYVFNTSSSNNLLS